AGPACRAVGCGAGGAAAGLERCPVRARTRLERPRAAGGALRLAAQPDAGARRGRPSVPRVGETGLRRLAADGAAVLRADGRRDGRAVTQGALTAVPPLT